jgi:carboxyl-terminal processing protease
MKHRFAVLVVLVVVMSSLVGGFMGGSAAAGGASNTAPANEFLKTFTEALDIIQKNYVDEVQTKQLIEGAINGMLASLDPHSAYLTPDLYKELQVDTKGSFGGLGIEITNKNGILTVVSPIEDTPAYRAGVKSGDQIMKIDGEFTKDMSLVDAVKKMRGPKDTKVTLTLKREALPELFDVTLMREIIRIQSVKSKMLEKGYGYVRVTQFQERTDDDLERALERLVGLVVASNWLRERHGRDAGASQAAFRRASLRGELDRGCGLRPAPKHLSPERGSATRAGLVRGKCR